jgi:predicted heme/steroid binding protein
VNTSSSISATVFASTTANSTTTVSNNQIQAQTSLQTFTLADLAAHNKSGDCYIAYKGTVYDLSASVAWAGCVHHGAHGGIDVTAIFPHPVSYFNTIPKVGTLVSVSTQVAQNSSSNTNQTFNSTSTSVATNSNSNTPGNSTSTNGNNNSGSANSGSGQNQTGSGSGNSSWGSDSPIWAITGSGGAGWAEDD